MNTTRTDHAVYEMDNREYWRTLARDACAYCGGSHATANCPWNYQPLWLRLLVGAAIAVALGVLLEVWR
jgi:hypothetical protein